MPTWRSCRELCRSPPCPAENLGHAGPLSRASPLSAGDKSQLSDEDTARQTVTPVLRVGQTKSLLKHWTLCPCRHPRVQTVDHLSLFLFKNFLLLPLTNTSNVWANMPFHMLPSNTLVICITFTHISQKHYSLTSFI